MLPVDEAKRIADEHDATLQSYLDWISNEVEQCAQAGIRNVLCTHPDLCELSQVPSALQKDVRRAVQRFGYRVEFEYIDAPAPAHGNPHRPAPKMLHLRVCWG